MSTHNIYHFQYKKENHPGLCLICSYWIFSKGLEKELETAMVKKPSVFKPLNMLKVYCINIIYRDLFYLDLQLSEVDLKSFLEEYCVAPKYPEILHLLIWWSRV